MIINTRKKLTKMVPFYSIRRNAGIVVECVRSLHSIHKHCIFKDHCVLNGKLTAWDLLPQVRKDALIKRAKDLFKPKEEHGHFAG